MSKSLILFVKLIILGCCFYYIFKDISLQGLLGYFGEFSIAAIILLGLYTLGVYWVSALKFNLFSHGKIGVKKAYFSVLITNAFNNIFPAKLGEVVKIVYLRQAHHISTSNIMPAVLMDRFFDVNILLLLVLIAMVFSTHAMVVWPFVAMITLGWALLMAARWFPSRFRGWINRVKQERIRNALNDNFNNLLLCLRSKMLFGGIGLTFVVWFFYYSIVGIFILWIAGVELTLYQTFVVFVFSAIGYAIPAAPAGIGVYEAAFVLTLGWYGVPKEQALAIGTVVHLVQIIPASVLGMSIFFSSNLRLSSVFSALKRQKN